MNRPPTAHVRAPVDTQLKVHPIKGFPGRYTVTFGDCFDMHMSAEQWDLIDGCVRAQIAALTQAAAS